MKSVLRIIAVSLIMVNLGCKLVYATVEAEVEPKIIRLEPGVKKVIVVPNEYEFADELDEFVQFRNRYATFWSMFYMIVFILPYVW